MTPFLLAYAVLLQTLRLRPFIFLLTLYVPVGQVLDFEPPPSLLLRFLPPRKGVKPVAPKIPPTAKPLGAFPVNAPIIPPTAAV